MPAHLVVPVVESSQAGEARRAAVRLAEGLGFDEVNTGRVALAVTELGTNLARHAKQGRILLLAGSEREPSALEVLAIDDGPGMADLDACLRDGFSSSGTAGTGLGAVKRLADEFSAYTVVGRGTVIAARFRAPGHAKAKKSLNVGAISTPAPGETACGDDYAIRDTGNGRAAVIVADGLGHGPTAAEASAEALAVFRRYSDDAPSKLLERAHASLRSTRGAAVAVAELDVSAGRIVFAGAGNVAGRIISGIEDRTLLSQNGTVGFQMRQVHDVTHEWPEHAMLVLFSDGLVSRWSLQDAPGLMQCEPIVVAAWLLREHCRGRDDATVVVIKRNRS